ncbi:hypothetical protein C2817_11540 [Pasteurella multocida]|nr:hypothetical protein [Pasteurella multocida]
MRQAEKLLNLEKSEFLPHGTDACVDKFTNKSCVVHLDITSNTDNNNFYALLAHEAVHIYQDMIKEMREEEPSPEFEAYSIQNIFLNLLNEFQKRQ